MLIRILKQGIPVALILAVIGYVMAGVAGMWLSSHSGSDTSVRVTVENSSADTGETLTQAMQLRLPLTLAAWGFGLVTVLELVRTLVRGQKPSTKQNTLPSRVTEDETEKLLNQLLQQADAAEAERSKPVNTPIPTTTCPIAPASENSPVNN
jgi:hypothetical protein